MKAFIVFSMVLALACAVAVDEPKKEKRGLYELESGHDSYESYDHHHQPLNYGYTKKEIITKKVPVPYPVEVEKHIPVPVKVPYPVKVEKEVPFVVERKVPVYVEKTVPVHVDRPYPVEVKVPVHVPVYKKEYVEAFIVFSMALVIVCNAESDESKKDKRGLWEESYDSYGYDNYDLGYAEKEVKQFITKKVPVPYPVEVEKHVPVAVKVPYPVEVEKKVPVVVEKKVPIFVALFFAFSVVSGVVHDKPNDSHTQSYEEQYVPQQGYENYDYDQQEPSGNYINDYADHDAHQIITKQVPVPYPVEVPNHVPVEVRVPYEVEVEKKVPIVVEKKVPVYVEKKVPVHVDRPYPVEVKVPVEVPVYQKEYVEIPKPYTVHVDKPYTVYVKHPVFIEKPVPFTVLIKKENKKPFWWLF
uniref:Cuticular protein (putative) n=1 Tax=Anopheles dirus TaxID=7168 RepID=A0A182MYR2_9DIPT